MSNAQAMIDARAAMEMVATLGGEIVSYRGGNGVVPTTGVLDQGGSFIDVDVTISAPGYLVRLLIEDVGSPHRGDIATDEDGTEWELLEEVAAEDQWTTVWTVQKR